MKIKIVTLNTWDDFGPYRKRWKFLIQELKRLQPDIFLLQEVSYAKFTKNILRHFHNYYFTAAYAPGLAIFSKYPINQSFYIKYKVQSKTEDHERGFLSAQIHLGRRKITLGNTHLSWQTNEASIRARQIRGLIQTVKRFKTHSVLAGDFNDIPDSKPVQLLKKSGWRDWFKTVHPHKKGITWDNKNQFIQSHSVQFPDRRIDFIFVDQKLTQLVRKKLAKVVFNQKSRGSFFPSDHYGVLAEFEIS